ncbi:hypothetical protein V8C86DRAFT_2459783 [Haematococcus lacustris]
MLRWELWLDSCRPAGTTGLAPGSHGGQRSSAAAQPASQRRPLLQRQSQSGPTTDLTAAEPLLAAAPGEEQPGPWEPPARLVAQVHDELLVECRDDPDAVAGVVQAVRQVMSGVWRLSVPLNVNIDKGVSWGSMLRC